MLETADKCISELEKKGCRVFHKLVFVPKDHGCGNRSFGRLDNLRSSKYSVIFLEMTEKKLTEAIKKLSAANSQLGPEDATKEVNQAIYYLNEKAKRNKD